MTKKGRQKISQP